MDAASQTALTIAVKPARLQKSVLQNVNKNLNRLFTGRFNPCCPKFHARTEVVPKVLNIALVKPTTWLILGILTWITAIGLIFLDKHNWRKNIAATHSKLISSGGCTGIGSECKYS